MSKKNIDEMANDLGQQTKKIVEGKSQELSQIADSCKQTIKDNPVSSMAIGVIVGLVLGKILSK